jgi:hypothetical protein
LNAALICFRKSVIAAPKQAKSHASHFFDSVQIHQATTMLGRARSMRARAARWAARPDDAERNGDAVAPVQLVRGLRRRRERRLDHAVRDVEVDDRVRAGHDHVVGGSRRSKLDVDRRREQDLPASSVPSC